MAEDYEELIPVVVSGSGTDQSSAITAVIAETKSLESIIGEYQCILPNTWQVILSTNRRYAVGTDFDYDCARAKAMDTFEKLRGTLPSEKVISERVTVTRTYMVPPRGKRAPCIPEHDRVDKDGNPLAPYDAALHCGSKYGVMLY